MNRKTVIPSVLFMMCFLPLMAQEDTSYNLTKGLTYDVEMQASVSHNHTPLWLNANKYGLSSLAPCNGYLKAGIGRPLSTDSARHWGVCYGLDMALAHHYSSDIIVQQAYAGMRWWHGSLTIGAKEYPMELKSESLSSGSQTLGINARSVPQVRLALDQYWPIPLTRGWLQLKGHIAYGKMTDGKWQRSFTRKQSHWTENTLYHSKAGYVRIGRNAASSPFSVELGLEMAAQFGGTSYMPDGEGGFSETHGGTTLKDYWRAFVPGGAEVNEIGTPYENAEGNQLGSWVMRLNWEKDNWRASLYADHFFEDHSAMFFLDYDGYGQGTDWDTRKRNRYFLYDLRDIMLGAELMFKDARPVQAITVEYIYTKYQSGAIYHDHTPSISDHVGGQDNYYNHGTYSGWQHWGQVLGNPLYRSVIYNSDGQIRVKDNRFLALHAGIEGRPAPRLYYRVLATWQEGLGTYEDPYTHKRHNTSVMAEAQYSFSCEKLRGWSITGACGIDRGSILGNSTGFQLTVRRTGKL